MKKKFTIISTLLVTVSIALVIIVNQTDSTDLKTKEKKVINKTAPPSSVDTLSINSENTRLFIVDNMSTNQNFSLKSLHYANANNQWIETTLHSYFIEDFSTLNYQEYDADIQKNATIDLGFQVNFEPNSHNAIYFKDIPNSAKKVQFSFSDKTSKIVSLKSKKE
ncbi:hypothetical protein I6N95_07815 [Vagococcus sp. BWB3-3]|uniref:DUF5067 domain-containing protein n=1 Tax=Vagococcus allomyrinae TaxID=2794353 RepID=A0A940PAD8_9ENTE|nr:hypothetical protein [Vagococcus allomyrinae]MBP1040907.1 hypothetical protein [Vagococcus allomyrinae]